MEATRLMEATIIMMMTTTMIVIIFKGKGDYNDRGSPHQA